MAGLNQSSADKKIADAMFKWIHSGLAGCSFAVKLSTDELRDKWRTIIVPCPTSTAAVDDIDKLLVAACETDREAVLLIFRDVELVDDLVRLINNLVDRPRWFWVEDKDKPIAASSAGRSRMGIGLRWKMPNALTSFVLGFGPLGFLPPTRRAPYTALTIPVCDQGLYRTAKDPGERHLCDMANEEFGTKENFDLVWAKTEAMKASMVNENDRLAAKAKVTFSLPEDCRSKLKPSQG
ncbi:MAG: hypothetical protein IID44_19565 [Planctomycetes bacterium]|nr:hypothetical protein [Planctomycetota bacterium]